MREQIALSIPVKMRYSTALVGLMAIVYAKEMPKDPVRAAELYDSGVIHQRIMDAKAVQLQQEQEMGVLNSAEGPYYQELHFAQCKDGKVIPFRGQNDHFYRCNNASISRAYRPLIVTILIRSYR